MISVTVIIPTYKPKNYLWECLSSLASQTLQKKQFEIILVLNGCCDPWKSQIEHYIYENMTDMNVLFLQIDTPGVSNARNVGIDNAKGEYITFIDDDDFVSSSFLEELLLVSQKDTIALCNTIATNDETGELMDYRISKEYSKFCVKGKQRFYKPKKFYSGPCMKLIHRNTIRNYRFDIRFKNGEDSLFMFLISDRMKWCNFTSPNAIYYRRKREGSAVSVQRSKKEKTKNSWSLIREYCRIFFMGFPRYNCVFFVTRIMGAIKSAK